jgi:adenosylcobinamide-GDP ribazoletransferase
VRGFRDAAAFLTRLPVGSGAGGGVRGRVDPRSAAGPQGGFDPGRSILWFPVVGGLLGLVVAAVYGVALLAVPAVVAATLAVGFGILLTGALHEDGLADTADALGGGWTRDEALAILEDPTHGTYGVVAIVVGLLLRVGALAALDGAAALAVLPAAHALSRVVAVGLLGVARPATATGLGASYAARLAGGRLVGAFGLGFVVGLASLGAWVVAAAFLAGFGAAVVGWLAVRKLGGVTGDVLGAAQQAAETLVLLLGAGLVANGIAPGWWR